jgi:Glycosyltransferase GT-D fold
MNPDLLLQKNIYIFGHITESDNHFPYSDLKTGILFTMFRMFTALYTTFVNDNRVFFYYCFSYIYNIRIPQLRILSEDQLSTQLQSGKSLIRVGDGEAMICVGRSIHYQDFHPTLQSDITSIITSYSSDSPYILAVPFFAIRNSPAELKAKNRYRIWRLFRAFFKIRFNHNAAYADAVMFYHSNAFADTLADHLKEKKIILVTKRDNMTPELKKSLSSLSENITYIESPATNAYDTLPQTTQLIDQACSNTLPEKLAILVAIGPAAKSLTYHYAKKGCQALDIGHGIEIIGQTKDYSDRL